MKPQTFSKFVFILIAFLILAGQSFAGKVSKETTATIRETIKEQVKHPGFYKVKDNLCCADVTFTITNEDKLLVKSIDSENEALTGYLKEQLSQILFYKLQSPMNQHYRIKLSFRLV
ncbi:MAG: hypothetical protein NTY96_00240 [Bacteroidetes bacterium]|nr:hypothetical protein [Bacteroidota bacterium]